MTPRSAEFSRAAKHLSQGEPALAERAAASGLARLPDDGLLWQVRGIARFYLQKDEAAVSDLETAMTLVPLHPVALWSLAELYIRRDKPEWAKPVLVSLVLRRNCPAELLPLAARCLGSIGEEELALQTCEELVRRAPENARGYFLIAYHMARLGYSATIVASRIKRACELAPDNVTYKASLGYVLANTSDSERALEILRGVDVDAISCPHLASRLARAMDKAGDAILASMWRSRAISLSEARD